MIVGIFSINKKHSINLSVFHSCLILIVLCFHTYTNNIMQGMKERQAGQKAIATAKPSMFLIWRKGKRKIRIRVGFRFLPKEKCYIVNEKTYRRFIKLHSIFGRHFYCYLPSFTYKVFNYHCQLDISSPCVCWNNIELETDIWLSIIFYSLL